MTRGRLDPSLIGNAVGNTVPLNNLAQIWQNALQLRSGITAQRAAEEEMANRQAVNDAYRGAVGEDGSVDQGKLMSALAQGGVGGTIPSVQKANVELANKRADTAKTTADTNKTVQETLYNGLKLMDNSIASLAANPQVTDRDVWAETARLVNAGAFRVQAAQKGVSEDEYARDLLSTMPVGNPAALKNWLIQTGMRVADASERLKLSLPKYDEQDRGGTINEGTINQLTGQRTAGPNIQKTNTPGEVLSAEVSMRGQNMKNTTDTEANAIAREAQQSQVIETPQGYAVVNKGTGMARPVAIGEQPALGKDSQVAKNAQMADRTAQMLPLARELLAQGPTASGTGAAADKMLNFMGYSTRGADRAQALEALSGWLTSNVPRFEGPQSDKDTEVYKTMAGRVGDRTLPVSTRLEALNIVEQVMRTYGGQRTLPFSGPPGTAPATTVAPRAPVPSPYTGPERRIPPVQPVQAGPAQRPSLDSFFRK